jgi:hypothetical protein
LPVRPKRERKKVTSINSIYPSLASRNFKIFQALFIALKQYHFLLSAYHNPLLTFTHDSDVIMASSIVAASTFVQSTLGYSFQDTHLLEEALDTTGLRSPGSNGRLAMIGDSRLKDVILDDWYASGSSKGSYDQTLDCRFALHL